MSAASRRRRGFGVLTFVVLALIVVVAAIAWLAYRDGAFDAPPSVDIALTTPSLPRPSLPEVEPPSVPTTPTPPAPIG